MKKKNISYLYSIVCKISDREKPLETQFLSEKKLSKDELVELSKTFDKVEKSAIFYHGMVVSNDNPDEASFLF